MNRAAEAAVPQARTMLVNAAKSMAVEDALRIVQGGETSVTQFFAGKTREPLTQQFLPIVSQATEKVSLAAKYNAVAGRAAKLGLLKERDANIRATSPPAALDGLYLVIGEQEREIRQDPVGTGSAILKKVFGGCAEQGDPAAMPSSRMRGRRRLDIVLAALAVLAAACTPVFNWREVPVGEGDLVALLPCKPDRAERMLPLGTEAVRIDMAGCEAGGVTFAIAHAEASGPAQASGHGSMPGAGPRAPGSRAEHRPRRRERCRAPLPHRRPGGSTPRRARTTTGCRPCGSCGSLGQASARRVALPGDGHRPARVDRGPWKRSSRACACHEGLRPTSAPPEASSHNRSPLSRSA